jgi:hypothetical protein
MRYAQSGVQSNDKKQGVTAAMSLLVQNNEQLQGFIRCAVCKVDFRGRVVFFD